MAKKKSDLQSAVDELFAPIGKGFSHGGKMKKKKAEGGIKIPTVYGWNPETADKEINKLFYDEYQPIIQGKYGQDTQAQDQIINTQFGNDLFNPDEQGQEAQQMRKNNPASYAIPILSAIDSLIPQGKINRQFVDRPDISYTPKMYGRGSQAIMAAGGSVEKPKPKSKTKKKYNIDDEIPSVMGAKSQWDENRTFKEIVTRAAKRGNIDPRLLFSSSLQEGMNKAALAPDEVSEAWKQNFAFTDEESTYPVDGFYNYGLDTFGTRYEGLVKKGYLPKDFDKSYKVFEGRNEKNEKIQTAAFRNNEDALVAKAAMLRDEMDYVNNYAKSKKVQLDDAARQYFTLASYNAGQGNAKKMIDEFAQSKASSNDYINKGMTAYKQVHQNVYPRYSRMSKLQFDAGGTMKQVGENHLDGGTFEFKGKSHEQGGIDISFGGQRAEVEGDEIAAVDKQGNLNIYGNMTVPGTKKKFKTVAKEIGLEEQKANKQLEKGLKIFDSIDERDMFSKFKANSALLKTKGAAIKTDQLSKSKELLAALQDSMLQMSAINGIDPIAMSQGKQIKAKNGAKLFTQDSMAKGGKLNGDKENYEELAKLAAAKYGIDPNIFYRMIKQESNFNPKAKSIIYNKKTKKNEEGALGIAQFMPKTGESYGLTREQMLSEKPEDVAKVLDAAAKHFKGLLDQNNNDPILATAAYNGGQTTVEFVKEQLGKKNISGSDWYNFMAKRRKTEPTQDTSAWQNQTFDYVSNIVDLNDKQFSTVSKEYRSKYYGKNGEIEPSTVTEPIYTEKDPLQEIVITAPRKYKPVEGNTRTDIPYKFGTPVQSSGPLQGEIDITQDGPIRSAADNNRLDIGQIIPELAAIGMNRTKPVPVQRYEPQLYSPYEVSFQDSINENNANFRAIQQTLSGNPAAIGTLAAQTYSANSKVNAEEFRVNQGIENEVTNKNVSLLNDAKLKNLGFADTQMVRQQTAQSNTKADLFVALNSLSSKRLQNKLENTRIKTYEPLFDYRYSTDKNGNITGIDYAGDAAAISIGGTLVNSNSGLSTKTKKDAYGNVIDIEEKVDNPNKQTLDKLKINRNNLDLFNIFPRQSRGRRD